jgi:FixJ family two-component response regulator
VNPHPPVFVVDDEEAVRKSLSKLLGAIGVPTEVYASAPAFLASYTSDRAGCLLVDLRMPGMSGLDLIEELKRRASALPVIVMTGHTDERSVQRLQTLPLLGFLEKPFSIHDLRTLVDRWRATF